MKAAINSPEPAINREVVAINRVSEEKTPNRRLRKVYNAYMRLYMQTARALRAGKACAYPRY